MPWKYNSFGVFNHLFCYIIVNLSKRVGEERRWQILCDKHDNNFV